MTERISIRAPIPGAPKKDQDPKPAARISRSLEERPAEEVPPPVAAEARETGLPAVTEPVVPGIANVAGIARHIIATFGIEAIAPLAGNPRYQIPVPGQADSDALPSPEEWIAGALRAYLRPESLQVIEARLKESDDERRRITEEADTIRRRMDDAVEAFEQKILDLERRLADSAVQQHRLREAAGRSVALQHLIDQTFGKEPRQSDLLAVLRDAMEQPSETSGFFITGLCLGWIEVRMRLPEPGGEDEDAAMERVLHGLRTLLARLSGHYIPERREILRAVGAYVSAFFTDYDFVSPEDWRHVDPAVHNAAGVGGQTVKEGRGYVVMRRSTRNTVVYADIIAE